MTLDRRRTRSTDVEELLLKAALHLLEQEGPEAVTVRRVAASAGVAPMGVYNHFDGKNGLIDAVFQLGFATLTEEMGTFAAIADTREALRQGFRRYRRLALDHPRTYEVMFLRAVPGFEPSEESKATARESFEALVHAVGRAMEDGVLAEGDPGSVAQLLWAACHGAVALEIADICLVADMSETYDDLVDALLRGFSPPEDRSGSPTPGARRARAR
ncbi:MAG TPA: TetR/AcrR family transcriptional regulator [Acidimicrobiales bacterium]